MIKNDGTMEIVYNTATGKKTIAASKWKSIVNVLMNDKIMVLIVESADDAKIAYGTMSCLGFTVNRTK